jgi:hypothetical protein
VHRVNGQTIAAAKQVLGDRPDRLAELDGVIDLVVWIRQSISRMQHANPDEPPPAVVFRSEAFAADFWGGRMGDG